MKDIPVDSLKAQLDGTGKNVLTVCTPADLSDGAKKKNLYADHAYAVISYKGNVVTLMNPWNATGIKGGTTVELSVDELQKWFVSLASTMEITK